MYDMYLIDVEVKSIGAIEWIERELQKKRNQKEKRKERLRRWKELFIRNNTWLD